MSVVDTDSTITNSSLDKELNHPLLDDKERMMKIIANPVYDKLTAARASNLSQLKHFIPYNRNNQKRFMNTNIDSRLNKVEYLKTMDISSTPDPKSKCVSWSYNNAGRPSISTTANTITHSTRKTSLLTEDLKDDAKSHQSSRHSSARKSASRTNNRSGSATKNGSFPKEGTIRYIMTKHGLEVHRYSAHNWLNIDLFTKDACGSQERAYADVMDKKHQYERLARRIYASEYYDKRLRELTYCRKSGIMSHEEWAKQSYQILCVKTLLEQSLKQEQQAMLADEMENNAKLSQKAYKQWKDSKSKEKIMDKSIYNKRDFLNENKTLALKHREFVTSTKLRPNNQSSSRPTTRHNTTLPNSNDSFSSGFYEPSLVKSETSNQDTYTTGIEKSSKKLPDQPPLQNSKKTSISVSTIELLQNDRWSLQAMLKRVVGLEPSVAQLKPSTNNSTTPLNTTEGYQSRRKQSPFTTNSDSGFESLN
ncbi:unnamed protein product [Didymodactylos carnosus]|uniref:Uncharacterized protein n=1 Tax=Didymodactylos carnosus TaxID=1234261 RepID=A0A813QY81_9BILA|nr:unnamed protein product [Didymodactylos carnosus]CAF0900496.1 unnamed protein product [Didymodactylos carnosus]CAF3556633.1 unnamed protein product [Didymodactylos carnosus]CAF3681278.1 unnamed protein product [Didymodactylos carnosus]